MADTKEKLLDSRTVAKRCSLTLTAVRELCRTGQLEGARRDGKDWRVPASSVTAYQQRERSGTGRIARFPAPFRRWFLLTAVPAVLVFLFLGWQSSAADYAAGKRQILEWLTDAGLWKEFAAARGGEALILIATFHRSQGTVDTEPQQEIARVLRQTVAQVHTTTPLRVEVTSRAFRSEDQNGAVALGKRYGASMIIWGSDTGVRISVHYANLMTPSCSVCSISNTASALLRDPAAYQQYVTSHLPLAATTTAFYTLSTVVYSQGFTADAIEIAERAAANTNPVPEPFLEVLRVAHLRRAAEIEPSFDYEAAIREYGRSMEYSGTPAGRRTLYAAYVGRAWCFIESDQPESALRDAEAAIALDSEKAEGFAVRGRARAKGGDPAAAMADLDQAVALDRRSRYAHFVRSEVLLAKGDKSGARRECDALIALDPKGAVGYQCRARVLAPGVDRKAALEAALANGGKSPTILVSLGAENHNAGRHDLALANYESALQIAPDYVIAQVGRAKELRALHRSAEAVEVLRKTIASRPKTAAAYETLAAAQVDLTLYNDALDSVDTAIRLGEDSAAVHFERGAVLDALGRHVEAALEFSTCINSDAAHAGCWAGRGSSYQNLGRYPEALSDLTRAIQLDPTKAFSFQQRARVHAAMGDRSAARADEVSAKACTQ
jgi:tetratricopeptide (TPR) repeat protein